MCNFSRRSWAQSEGPSTEWKMEGATLKYWRLYLLMLVLGIGGTFQYGIQVSLITFPAEHIQRFVNHTWTLRYGAPLSDSNNKLIWSFVLAVLSLGGWVGAIHAGRLPVIYGRKKTLLFNNVVAVVAALLMIFSRKAKSFEMIFLGRFLSGYNIGLGLNVHLMYLGESSPRKLRGVLTLTGSIFIGLGKLTGQILGIKELMGTDELWPYLLAVSGIPALLQFVTLQFFPEAPRYLYIDKGDTEGAKQALQWLWQEDNLKVELEDMQEELKSMQGEEAKTLRDALTSRSVRWQILTLALPCSGIQFSGINALYFYAFDIFHESGVPEDQTQHLALGIGATEATAVALCGPAVGSFQRMLLMGPETMIPVSFLIECVGRKKLMGYGYLMMGVTMSVLTVTLSLKHLNSWIPYLNIALIFCVICIYGLGPCGGCMALSADLFLQAWRPPAYVISGTINWLSLFLVGMVFGYVVDGLGQFCFLIFVAYTLFSGVFLLWFVPETKGKTMVEIMQDFNHLNYKNANPPTTPTYLSTKF